MSILYWKKIAKQVDLTPIKQLRFTTHAKKYKIFRLNRLIIMY